MPKYEILIVENYFITSYLAAEKLVTNQIYHATITMTYDSNLVDPFKRNQNLTYLISTTQKKLTEWNETPVQSHV